MGTEIDWAAVRRVEAASDRIESASSRAEDAAHRLAYMLEPGYGGNGLRLIELLESQEVKPAAPPAPVKVILRPAPLMCFMAGVLCTIGAWSLQLDLWGMEESVRRMVNEWGPAWRTVPEALGMILLGAWVYRRELRP